MVLWVVRNVGIYVLNEIIECSMEYVKCFQNLDGGFVYMFDGGESDFLCSVVVIVVFYNVGIYDGEEIE